MFCTSCGKPMSEGQKFCPACGAATRGNAAPAAAAMPAQSYSGDEEIVLLSRMNDMQRAIYNSRRKDPTVALLLCLFLGGVGAHHFYLGKTTLGVVYLIFFWTFIPALIAFVELFFVMRQTRRHNVQLAQEILSSGVAYPAYV